MVVKPAVGSGSRGVSYAEDAGGLVRAAAGLFAAGEGRVLVQERLPRDGKGIGVSLLMGRGGDLKAFFVHRRLREFPVSGGPSTLRESVYRPEAVQAAHELLKSTDFRGVAMVEFKTDARDGKIKLLEVNPRFWGSLSLAVDAGVNFPYLLLLEAFDIPFPPLDRYRIGHRCRWLLPGDIQHFIANREQRKTTPGFFRFRERNLTYDVLKWNDPMPALGTLLSWFPYARGPQFEHIRNRRTI
jgi:predicted ATP-grasp superfamily ATP-dependent carboligase